MGWWRSHLGTDAVVGTGGAAERSGKKRRSGEQQMSQQQMGQKHITIPISNNNCVLDCEGRVPGLEEHGVELEGVQGSGGSVFLTPYGAELCIVKIPNMKIYNNDISRLDAETLVMRDGELRKQPIAELQAVHSWQAESGDAKKAFVFKYYRGGDLMALLTQPAESRDPRLNGPSVELDMIVLLVVHRICSVLQLLHRMGFVHCDIKPENIFCPSADYFGLKACVLGDFGGLKRIGVDNVVPQQTGTKNWVPWKDGFRYVPCPNFKPQKRKP